MLSFIRRLWTCQPLSVILAFFSFISLLWFSLFLSHQVPGLAGVTDVWFGADTLRVSLAMTDPARVIASDSGKHPIFSLLTIPVSSLLIAIGVSEQDSIRYIISMCSGGVGFVIFVTARMLSVRAIDSMLLSLVFASSAANVFWWSIPETFPLGGLSILAPFFVLATRTKKISLWILGVAISLSIATTNVIAGLAACWSALSRRSFIYASIMAFSLVALLSLLQAIMVPQYEIFFVKSKSIDDSLKYHVSAPSPLTPIRVMGLFVFPGVSPVPAIESVMVRANNPKKISPVQIQYNSFSATLRGFGLVAVLSWLSLILYGVYSFWRNRKDTAFFYIPVLVFYAFQIFFHSFYGDIGIAIFMFSPHLAIPALLTMSAGFIGLSSRLAIPRTLAICFILSGLFVNVSRFSLAADYARSILAF